MFTSIITQVCDVLEDLFIIHLAILMDELPPIFPPPPSFDPMRTIEEESNDLSFAPFEDEDDEEDETTSRSSPPPSYYIFDPMRTIGKYE